MTILHEDNFTAGVDNALVTTSNTQWDEVDTSTNYARLESTEIFSGLGQWVRWNPTSGSPYTEMEATISSTSELYFRGYFFFDTNFASFSQEMILFGFRDSYSQAPNMRVLDTAKLSFLRPNNTVHSMTRTIVRGDKVRIEARVKVNGEAYEIRTYWNSNIHGNVSDETISGGSGGTTTAMTRFFVNFEAWASGSTNVLGCDALKVVTADEGWIGTAVVVSEDKSGTATQSITAASGTASGGKGGLGTGSRTETPGSTIVYSPGHRGDGSSSASFSQSSTGNKQASGAGASTLGPPVEIISGVRASTGTSSASVGTIGQSSTGDRQSFGTATGSETATPSIVGESSPAFFGTASRSETFTGTSAGDKQGLGTATQAHSASGLIDPTGAHGSAVTFEHTAIGSAQGTNSANGPAVSQSLSISGDVAGIRGSLGNSTGVSPTPTESSAGTKGGMSAVSGMETSAGIASGIKGGTSSAFASATAIGAVEHTGAHQNSAIGTATPAGTADGGQHLVGTATGTATALIVLAGGGQRSGSSTRAEVIVGMISSGFNRSGSVSTVLSAASVFVKWTGSHSGAGTAQGLSSDGEAVGFLSDLPERTYRIGDYNFGNERYKLRVERLEINPFSTRLDDVSRVGEDGRYFGTDDLGNTLLSFVGHIHGTDPEDTMNAWSEFSALWRDHPIRREANGVVPLKIRYPGRTATRIAYGRPRELSQTLGQVWSTYVPVEWQFHMVDHMFYSSDEKYYELEMLTGINVPGLMDPLKSPLTSMPISSVQTNISVGGELPTWLRVRFNGPIQNPTITVGNDFSLTYEGQILQGEWVELDPRPWSRGLRRSLGIGPGNIKRGSTPLRKLKIKPGNHFITYDGLDPSRSASGSLTWQNAWSTF